MTRYAYFHPETAGVGITDKWMSASQILVGTYCYNIDWLNWLVVKPLYSFRRRKVSTVHVWMSIDESIVPDEYRGQALLLS